MGPSRTPNKRLRLKIAHRAQLLSIELASCVQIKVTGHIGINHKWFWLVVPNVMLSGALQRVRSN